MQASGSFLFVSNSVIINLQLNSLFDEQIFTLFFRLKKGRRITALRRMFGFSDFEF